MRNKFRTIAVALYCGVFLLNVSAAQPSTKPTSRIAQPAVIHGSGGSVLQSHVQPHQPLPRESVVAVYPALPRNAPIFKLHRQLLREGIQLIRVGEDITLVMHSEDYFYPESPRLYQSRRALHRLRLISAYLNYFDKIGVSVGVYTSSEGSSERNVSLSQHRADAIVDNLVRNNVEARLIFAQGYGGAFPIANNKTQSGRVMNERIEISLRVLPKDQHVRQTAW